ncbi:TetR/AcrR family transcriptional regulator [Paraburkholderia sp. 32]|uniref:TetR/AcrR family transcriptional regulator n=1 Tax=Paraburkholderia sp. 32 TaxID=2991057 RepID=UPI003D1AD698
MAGVEMNRAAENPASGLGKRDEIVRSAYGVFYEHGFHAAGVDSLLKGTGISKRTLYQYFASKEDLIQATIEHYRQNAALEIRGFVDAAKVRNRLARPLAVFDWLEMTLQAGHKFGCFVINAKSEYDGRHAAIERSCEGYIDDLERVFTELLVEAGCPEPKRVAQQLLLLFQGAIVNTQGGKHPGLVRVAKMAAKVLLENASAG